MPITVYLIRHGHRQDHVDPNYTLTSSLPDKHNPPLSSSGLDQARRTGRFVANVAGDVGGVKVVVSSPFRRCVETAEAVVEAFVGESRRTGVISTQPPSSKRSTSRHSKKTSQQPPPTLTLDNRLSEFLCPHYFPHNPSITAPECPYPSPTYPESYLQMTARFTSAFTSLMSSIQGTTDDHVGVVMVTHGLGVKAILTSLGAISEDDERVVGCCSVSVLVSLSEGRWSVRSVGDESHLLESPISSPSSCSSSPSSLPKSPTNKPSYYIPSFSLPTSSSSSSPSSSWTPTRYETFTRRTLAMLG